MSASKVKIGERSIAKTAVNNVSNPKFSRECLRCQIESKDKVCKCTFKETNFHHIEAESLEKNMFDKMHLNAIGEFATKQHQRGVRNTKINKLADKFHDQQFYRTVQEKAHYEERMEKRKQMKQMFQEFLQSVKLNGTFKESVNLEKSLEKSIFKILVQSTARSPIDINKVIGVSKSSGSGFLVDASKRYIVTNGHVVKDADEIIVESAGNTEQQFEAKAIKISFDLDIAILEVTNSEQFDSQKYEALKLCTEQKRIIEKIANLEKTHCSINRLNTVFAVGYPLGSSTYQISTGIISGFEGISDELVIQITAPISHGSSGGALLNQKSEVIGVTSSGVPIGENIGFAIPIQSVINMLDAIEFDKKNGFENRIILKLPYFELEFKRNTKNDPVPIVFIDDSNRLQIVRQNNEFQLTNPNQPGILIEKIGQYSIFQKPLNGGKEIQLFDRLISLDGFSIDDFGNTGEDTYPRTMPAEFIFRSLRFNQEFTATFVRNTTTGQEEFTNTYLFSPLKPEEEYPIRPLLKEEIVGNLDLQREFTPFVIGNQLLVVRLNSDFISLAGDEMPQIQAFKEISLIKEPLLLIVADKKKFVETPDIIDTINNIPVRKLQDLEKFSKESVLIVKTKKGNVVILSQEVENEKDTSPPKAAGGTISLQQLKKLIKNSKK